VSNLDGRVTQNSTDIAGIKGDLADVSKTAANAVAYDSADHSKVTLGGTDSSATVQLTNVAAGDLSDSSTDAVNGSQLGATNARVSATESAIANLEASGGGSTATGQDAAAMGTNADASGDNSTAAGSNAAASGNERRVTNVAPGVNGTDATNVNQLNALRNDVSSSLSSIERSAMSGVAAAMAMPNLMPSAPGKTVVGAGVANYKGYSAFAAGATYRSENSKWLMNAAVSVTPNGDTGVRAQAGYEF
jgi:autotransporter adhesin